MYPTYHNASDLTSLHQAEIKAERDAIRQARLARPETVATVPSLFAQMASLLASWGSRVAHPGSVQKRPSIRIVPSQRS